MKVIKKNEDLVILKLTWFEKYYGDILLLLFLYPIIPTIIFALIIPLQNNFFILIFVLLLFLLSLLFSYKFLIIIDFMEEKIFTRVKVLGIQRLIVLYVN